MFSSGVERAVRLALKAHNGQVRKGGDGQVPYAVHPIHMAIMLAGFGLDDAVIQAALLHDVVEDCDGYESSDISREFGTRVAGIVAELTEDKALSWSERKEAGIAHVAGMSSDATSVKAVDSMHNLESLRVELETAIDSETVWRDFQGGRDGTLDVASRLVAALETRLDPRLGRVLRATLERVRALAGIG